MAKAIGFELSSRLALTPEEVGRLLTLESVNRELGPLLRMTAPPAWAARPIFEWPRDRRLFASWILLFGFIPVDRHRFLLRSADPQSGFFEESSSLVNRRWCHRRFFSWDGETCHLTDTVVFVTRLPLLGRVLAPVYRAVFRHRHRVLRSAFGGVAG